MPGRLARALRAGGRQLTGAGLLLFAASPFPASLGVAVLRDGQAQVAAQRAGLVLRADQAALAQDRHHLAGEPAELVRVPCGCCSRPARGPRTSAASRRPRSRASPRTGSASGWRWPPRSAAACSPGPGPASRSSRPGSGSPARPRAARPGRAHPGRTAGSRARRTGGPARRAPGRSPGQPVAGRARSRPPRRSPTGPGRPGRTRARAPGNRSVSEGSAERAPGEWHRVLLSG
jgi:hypothetical protein